MKLVRYFGLCLIALSAASLAGCSGTNGKSNAKEEAPPAAKVEHESNTNEFQVDHPEQFALATAAEYLAARSLSVTGTVTPDVSRSVPVISIATGRVMEVHARLGDTVKKGQLLLRVQSADMAGAFSDYKKAVADEILARSQYDRTKDLYEKGALALKDLEVAQDAEDKAKVDVQNTSERLRVLGGSIDHPSPVVDIVAPVSGVITDQQVTTAAGVAGLGSPNPFTISDLSNVWILCDVYENDLASVHVGETAEIRLNAFPDKIFTGRISNVGPVLDPNLRTAKVRVEVRNPGSIRVGMFVTATFHAQTKTKFASVPATAILHLHDRDWVFVPAGGKKFRLVEVTSGESLPNKMQAVLSGIQPGQQLVANALVMQNTVEQ